MLLFLLLLFSAKARGLAYRYLNGLNPTLNATAAGRLGGRVTARLRCRLPGTSPGKRVFARPSLTLPAPPRCGAGARELVSGVERGGGSQRESEAICCTNGIVEETSSGVGQASQRPERFIDPAALNGLCLERRRVGSFFFFLAAVAVALGSAAGLALATAFAE